jgi:signal transduction histidine kinase
MYWSKNEQIAFLFANIAFFGVLQIPVSMLHFVSSFLGYNYRKFIYCLYLLNVPLALLQYKYFIFYEKIKICFWGYYPKAGVAYSIVFIEFCLLFVFGLYLLFKNLRNKNFSVIRHQQIKYLFFSFSILVLGVGDYLTKFGDIQIYPFGYILILIFVITICITIVNFNLLDIRLVITNGTILVFLYIFVLGIPIYLGLYTKQWFISFILLFVFSTLAPLIFRFLQRKAELILLAEQERYQQLLMQASTGMIEKDYDISKLSKLIVRIIKRSVKIVFVSLYIFDEAKNVYVNIDYRGRDKKVLKDFPKDIEFIEFMKKKKKPFFFSALPEQYKNELMKINSGITLIIPSIFKDRVIGFLLLGDKENRTLYSPRDIEVFGVLSNQAALAIENCMFLERSQRQQKRLFEAEKLASIGGMADGMAHQIRNRLNSFGLAAELLSYDVQDFSQDHKSFIEQHPNINEMIKSMNELILSINENVKKTNTVLTGILDFAKPKGSVTNKENFSMKEIMDSAIMLVQVKHHREKVPIVLDISDDDKIYGIKYQIQEVCFNCIDNAFEAIMEKEQHIQNPLFNDIDKSKPFIPEIRVSLKYFIERNKYQIIIKDNGIGIKPENRAKVFSAFFTTKPSSKSGSGIGSYVARRMIVEAHNGDISFESEYGEGTTFTITLPLSSKREKEVLE